MKLGPIGLWEVVVIANVVAVIFIAKRRHVLGARRWWTLGGLARSIASTLRAPIPDASFARLEDVRMEFRLRSGRAARVSFDRVHGRRVVRLEVAADEAPSLTITEAGTVDQVRRFFGLARGVSLGARSFDERFVLGAPDPERVRRAIGPELRHAITGIFEKRPVRNLTFANGRLAIEANVRDIELRDYPNTFDFLDEIARAFDRKPVQVRALGLERRALADQEGRLRCSYCHEHVTGDEPDLVACESCATVLHGACWDEHGGCPIWGCRGERPERARAR